MIITGKKFSKPAMSRVINGDTQLSVAPAKPETLRLDHLLVQRFPAYNRSTLQNFIKSGCVAIDGKTIVKPNAQVLPTAQLALDVPSVPVSTQPQPKVIYEDAHVLVLNKPAGLLSMRKGAYAPEPTLEDYGLLVHRLDRDTSGVVILAKDAETKRLLQKQFQARKTHKTYYAVVVGHPKLDQALIDLPIARNLKKPTTFKVGPSGRPAQTRYQVISHNAQYSLLELQPITGRTHQLRVHLQHLGTPILGDRVYGQPSERLYLHAHSLEITIPPSRRQTFTAPLPPEFQQKVA